MPHDIEHSLHIESTMMPKIEEHAVSRRTRGKPEDSTVWTDQLSAPTLHPFSSRSPIGPTVPVPNTPKEIFQLFFTPSLMEEIKQQTNNYAKEALSPGQNDWTDTTVEELYVYFGFNFLMGLNPRTSLKDYWQKILSTITNLFQIGLAGIDT